MCVPWIAALMLREGPCSEHTGPCKSIGVNDGWSRKYIGIQSSWTNGERSHKNIGTISAARFSRAGAGKGGRKSQPGYVHRRFPGKYPGLRPGLERQDRQLAAVRRSNYRGW